MSTAPLRRRLRWILALAAGAAGAWLLRGARAEVAPSAPVRQAQGQPFFVPAGSASQPARRVPLPAAQRQERRFLQFAAAQLALQAEASRRAAARSSSTGVRDLAAAALARHGEVQPQLVRMLHARDMALPLVPNEHRKLLRDLERLPPGRLDRLYVEEVMLRSLQAELADYEAVVAEPGDDLLRGWADRQLPTLRLLQAKAKAALPAGASRPAARAL